MASPTAAISASVRSEQGVSAVFVWKDFSLLVGDAVSILLTEHVVYRRSRAARAASQDRIVRGDAARRPVVDTNGLFSCFVRSWICQISVIVPFRRAHSPRCSASSTTEAACPTSLGARRNTADFRGRSVSVLACSFAPGGNVECMIASTGGEWNHSQVVSERGFFRTRL